VPPRWAGLDRYAQTLVSRLRDFPSTGSDSRLMLHSRDFQSMQKTLALAAAMSSKTKHRPSGSLPMLCNSTHPTCFAYITYTRAPASGVIPTTPQLLHGPPGLGRDTLFCLLGVAPAEVALAWGLLRFSAVLRARATSSASSSVAGRTASPVSLSTNARQYKLRSANCSECSEPLLVLGLSTQDMSSSTRSEAVDISS